MRHFRVCTFAFTALAVVLIAGAARADTPGFTMTGFSTDQSANHQHFSLGYTFEATQPITITALGALDIGGDTIATAGAPIPVKIYWSGPTPDYGKVYPAPVGHGPGGIQAGQLVYASATVSASDPIYSLSGGPYTSGDGFRYHMLDNPITLPFVTGTTPAGGFYMITESDLGTGFKAVAQNFAAASNLFGPGMTDSSTSTTYHPTYEAVTSDDNAGYSAFSNGTGTTTADFDAPGMFGPNFMMEVPEPGAIGLLAFCGALLLRRHR